MLPANESIACAKIIKIIEVLVKKRGKGKSTGANLCCGHIATQIKLLCNLARSIKDSQSLGKPHAPGVKLILKVGKSHEISFSNCVSEERKWVFFFFLILLAARERKIPVFCRTIPSCLRSRSTSATLPEFLLALASRWSTRAADIILSTWSDRRTEIGPEMNSPSIKVNWCVAQLHVLTTFRRTK